MSIEYKITSDEYVSAGLTNGEIRGKAKLIHRTIEVALIFAAALFVYYEQYVFAGGMIGAVLGANLFPYLFRKTYVPWYLKRHYLKYPGIQEPVLFSVSDDGIRFVTDNGNSLVL